MIKEKTLYLDCSAGVSGDMFTGAMLGLGADPDKLRSSLKSLGLDDFDIAVGTTEKCGIAATKFDVILHHEEHEHEHGHNHDHDHDHDHGRLDLVHSDGHGHRNLHDIEAIIDESPLNDGVKELSKRIFGFVARAEGKVHGLPADKVHFHEVGAADSIADIVSAAVCLEDLGVKRVICSPLNAGGGTVKCAHGILPVPAPATAEIFLAGGVPFKSSGEEGEMVTPTGAAIVAAISEGFGPMPAMVLERIGIGAGTKDFSHPNILRAFLGETESGADGAADAFGDEVDVLETCVDDTTGEALGSCLEELFAAGVRDAYFSPVFMKKCRPAYLLTVLCESGLDTRAAGIIFSRTGAIGLRVRSSRRIVMQREIRNIATRFGDIPVKFSAFGGIKKFKAEYGAVEKAAKAFDVPPSAVYAEVSAAVERI